MDIEQLKLILETVKGISGDAQLVAVCWILVDKLLPMLCWMIVFGVLIWRIPSVFSSFIDHDKFMRWARDQFRIGSYGCLSDSERDATEQKLRELVIASKANSQAK